MKKGLKHPVFSSDVFGYLNCKCEEISQNSLKHDNLDSGGFSIYTEVALKLLLNVVFQLSKKRPQPRGALPFKSHFP